MRPNSRVSRDRRSSIFHVFFDVLVPNKHSNVALSTGDFLEKLGHVPTHDSFLGLMLLMFVSGCVIHIIKKMSSSRVLKRVHAYFKSHACPSKKIGSVKLSAFWKGSEKWYENNTSQAFVRLSSSWTLKIQPCGCVLLSQDGLRRCSLPGCPQHFDRKAMKSLQYKSWRSLYRINLWIQYMICSSKRTLLTAFNASFIFAFKACMWHGGKGLQRSIGNRS